MRTEVEDCEESLHVSGGQRWGMRTWPREAPGQSMRMGSEGLGGEWPKVSCVAEILGRLGIRGGH